MPISRPTFNQIVTRVRADTSKLCFNGAAVPPHSFHGAIVYVVAGVSHVLYGALVIASKFIVPVSITVTNLRRVVGIERGF